MKSGSNENIVFKSFKKQKEQSQKELSINILRGKLGEFSDKFNLQNISDLADEIKNLPTIKIMNMDYLAGALVYLNSLNDNEPTPQNFSKPYIDQILKVIYNISPQEEHIFTTAQYEEIFNYVFCVYSYRYNSETKVLKSQVYLIFNNNPPEDVINNIENISNQDLKLYIINLQNGNK